MTYSPQNVPPVDSANNKDWGDVIGNKSDTHDGDSLRAMSHTFDEHFHNPGKVYPTLANGVVVTAGGAWALGSFAVIVPTNGITSDFDIHHISIEAVSAIEVYELVLYSGPDASEVEIGRVRFTKSTNNDATQNIPFMCPIVAANSQIKAKLATQGGSDTVTISIFYHIY